MIMGLESKNGSIWFVNTCGPKNIGGGETARELWTKAFMERDYNVVWYCPQAADLRLDQQNFVPEGVVTRSLDSLNYPLTCRFPSPKATTNFLTQFQQERPKRVIINGYADFNLPLVGGLLGLGHANTIIQVFHGDPRSGVVREDEHPIKREIKKALRPTRDLLMRKLLSHSDIRTIAVSEFVARRVKELGIADDPVVCYPPVQPDFCELPIKSPNKERLSVVTVSRLSPEKGLLFLGEIAKTAHALALPFIFNLVGAPSDRRFGEFLKGAIGDDVNLKGAKIGQELCAAYREADLFIMPSPNEGFGLVTVESLGHGLPVIATDIPPTREIFSKVSEDDILPGILIDPAGTPDSVQSATNFLRSFATNTDLRLKLSAIARNARNVFGSERVAREFVNIVLT